jgi:metal transporter CNNM
LGYQLTPVVKFFMALLYPIAKPLGLLLDWLVDEDTEDQWYDRAELAALVRIQHEERTRHFANAAKTGQKRLTRVMKYVRHNDRQWNDLKAELFESVKEREPDKVDGEEVEAAVDQLSPPLHQNEVHIVEGALAMKTKLAMDIYTPFQQCYAVPDDLILDKTTITTIYGNGYSRVPVYRRNEEDEDDITAFTGYLMTRQLMLVDWEHMRPISTLPLVRPTCTSPRTNLVDLLRLLQKQGPLTFVCARPDLANRALTLQQPIPVEAGLLGIISLVDIMESVLQDRIYDEVDIHKRNQGKSGVQRLSLTLPHPFSHLLSSFLVLSSKLLLQYKVGLLQNFSHLLGDTGRIVLLFLELQYQMVRMELLVVQMW